jgi:hypothetical protein
MMRVAVLSLLLPAAAIAEPVERRLHVDQAAASSFLWNDWNRFQENYHPLYIADDDPRTAWVEGVEGNGEGQWIRLAVSELDGATRVRLRLRSGYHKSPSLFRANARPKDVTLKLSPSNLARKVTLEDRGDGWQEVLVDQPAGKLDAVELVIDSVYPGTKYTDTCISDAQIYVTAETRENPAYEKGKLEKILAWKAERAEAARLFKKASARDLPLLGAYRFTVSDTPGGGLDLWEKCAGDDACWTRESLARAGALEERHGAALAIARETLEGKGLSPGRLAPADRRSFPSVDGLVVPELWAYVEHGFGYQGLELPLVDSLAALRSDQLGALEARDLPAREKAMKGDAPGCKSMKGKTYVWLRREKQGAGPEMVRALFLVRCGRIEARDGYSDVAALQVAVYDVEGRLELTAGPGYVNVFGWSEANVLSGGRGVYPDGRTSELTPPPVAAR